MTFNAKNLTYESREPNFLRKLKSGYGGSVRHERPLARPRKHKIEEDDNEPTYVDEESQDTITKTEYEAMMNMGEKKSVDEQQIEKLMKTTATPKSPKDKEESTEKRLANNETWATIGRAEKRRLGRAIWEGKDNADNEKDGPQRKIRQKSNQAKKIKLSFDEDAIDQL